MKGNVDMRIDLFCDFCNVRNGSRKRIYSRRIWWTGQRVQLLFYFLFSFLFAQFFCIFLAPFWVSYFIKVNSTFNHRHIWCISNSDFDIHNGTLEDFANSISFASKNGEIYKFYDAVCSYIILKRNTCSWCSNIEFIRIMLAVVSQLIISHSLVLSLHIL